MTNLILVLRNASNVFNLEQGVIQSRPLSGTLFVLGIEILALAFMQKPKIEGIRVGAREINIAQYADDTTVFLKRKTESEWFFYLTS